ncbi:MAG: alpha/beta hydrolase [Firmicutes bacterium]|nr:alpha/beta hydrolase [Bacillota bacterium]
MKNTTALYRTRGEGRKKILCIHGTGCNSLHWLKVEPPEGWQIIAVDLPGHGLSKEDPLDSIDEYATWVRNFIIDLGERVLLAGHSMGGAIAQSVANSYPDLLSGLVLACTGARLQVSPQLLDLCRGEDTTPIARFLSKYAYGKNVSQAQITQWQEELGTPPPAVYLAGFTACSNFDFRDKLAAIQLPTLILYAAEDRMTPPDYAKHLHAQLPYSTLAEVKDSGHMAILEQPGYVSEILAEFCEDKI